jgi:hypothetical protein
MIYDTLQYVDAVHYTCSDDRNTDDSRHTDIVHLEHSGKKKREDTGINFSREKECDCKQDIVHMIELRGV